MPTFTRSSFNLGGSYQPDAMDQVEQWNANRGDQWSQFALNQSQKSREEDWRKEVALKQLGLQSEMYQGGRQDAASARQMEADRFGKQFGYMEGRDKLANEQWGKQFGLQEQAAKQAIDWRNEDLSDRRSERELAMPERQLKTQLAQLQLERERKREQLMSGGGSMYNPTTPKGKETYAVALQQTGEPLQASLMAKQTEQKDAAEEASYKAQELAGKLQDYFTKDTKRFGADPNEMETSFLIQEVEALKTIMRNAGASEGVINQNIRELIKNNLRDPSQPEDRTYLNAGNVEALKARFGISR